MGRLKKEHSGWHTSGLWLKYQSPKVNEQPVKSKSKKDTNKWCRGKIGVEHEWHRYQQERWNDDLWKYISAHIEIKCAVCRKEKYIKTAKAAKYNYPLHLFVKDASEGYEPVQVRVNGKYLPIDYLEYQKGKYYCSSCGYWH